jgi:iron(III) transport system substrate-binding protein
MRARRLATVPLLALTVFLAGCGGGSGGGSGRSIVLYNGQHPQLTDELVAAFEKQTGISVLVRSNDGVVLADQLLQEGSSSPADVYLSENSPELEELDQHRMLARLPGSTLRQVPRRDEPPSGDLAPIALRISGLVYDPGRVSKASLPTSILDLAEPGWKGKVAVAPTDSDFLPLVGAVIAAYGTKPAESWLARLKRNAEIFQTDEAVVAAVNRGTSRPE